MCDDLRDTVLPELGVRLEDKDGAPTTWKLVNKRTWRVGPGVQPPQTLTHHMSPDAQRISRVSVKRRRLLLPPRLPLRWVGSAYPPRVHMVVTVACGVDCPAAGCGKEEAG